MPVVPDCTKPVNIDPLNDIEPYNKDMYWKFLDELEANFNSFISDARAGDINKSAALRARKMSVVLRKSLKEYRDVSVAHDKTHYRKNKKVVELSKAINELI